MSGYPFRSPSAQQSSQYGGYPSQGQHYPVYGHHDGGGGNAAAYYDDEDDARYPTNEYDQAAYANEPYRGAGARGQPAGGGLRRADSFASDLGGVGEHDAYRYSEKDDGLAMRDASGGPGAYAGGNPPGEAYGFGGPAGHGGVGGAMGYNGKSIWTRSDKRAFQERSTFGKICGPIFCVVVIAIIAIISAVCLVFIFARPPNFALDGATIPVPFIDASNSAFGFNTTIDFSVSNPNSISATVQHLNAVITTQNLPNVTIGKGTLNNQKIDANTNTTIHFPLSIQLYNPQQDPSNAALRSVASQCGWTGGSGSGSVTLNIKVDGKISVLGIGVGVPVSTTITPQCPSLGTLQSALGALGGDSELGKIVAQVLGGNIGRAASEAADHVAFRMLDLPLQAAQRLSDAEQRKRQQAGAVPSWFAQLANKAAVQLDAAGATQRDTWWGNWARRRTSNDQPLSQEL